MIDLKRIHPDALSVEPFKWAFIDRLFTPDDARALAKTYPRDHFKVVKGYDGEKGYEYEARALIGMGSEVISFERELSPAWRALARDLLSSSYKNAMSELTGVDLRDLTLEVNIFHYGPSAWLGPHVDLKDKIVTHVLYFNDSWEAEQGGCFTVLRSHEMCDVVAQVLPVVGNSSVVVRSQNSWHAVTPVAANCRSSRRSMTVTFYRPGSISTMWPPGDTTPLHYYGQEHLPLSQWLSSKWQQFASFGSGSSG